MIGEGDRTSVLSESEVRNESELRAALIRFLDGRFQPVPLAALNRRFGNLSLKVAGRSLRSLLVMMEKEGELASRLNVNREKTYVYGPETWLAMKTAMRTLGNSNYMDEQEERCDPPKRKLSGAARRKLERQGF